MDAGADDLIQFAKSLRAYYSADNAVGLLLDDLISDVERGAPRQEILDDADRIAQANPNSTVERTIARLVGAFNQGGAA